MLADALIVINYAVDYINSPESPPEHVEGKREVEGFCQGFEINPFFIDQCVQLK